MCQGDANGMCGVNCDNANQLLHLHSMYHCYFVQVIVIVCPCICYKLSVCSGAVKWITVYIPSNGVEGWPWMDSLGHGSSHGVLHYTVEDLY